MKIFLLFATVLLPLTSARAQVLKLEAPAEFQFVHCTAQASKNIVLVKHYVIDIRTEQHALYTQLAAKKTKAIALNNLQLVDDRLLANTLEDADVSWVSKKNHLVFKLNILDNDGYLMSGSLDTAKTKIKIRCREVSTE